MVKKLVNKQVKKHTDGKCAFCPCDDYKLLDLHRIVPGEDGGKYTDFNTVSLCSSCHRKVHGGRIKILGKHFSTAGKYAINYIEDEVEKWCYER